MSIRFKIDHLIGAYALCRIGKALVKNVVGLLSLVELIIYSYLHQERELSLWLEGESEVNESIISHWAKGRI